MRIPVVRIVYMNREETFAPQFLFRALNVHLVAQGLAGVAGLGHPHGAALEGQGVQRVLHRLGDGHTTGENLQQLLAGVLDCDGSVLGGDIGDGAAVVIKRL